jgi:hypothetical protein
MRKPNEKWKSLRARGVAGFLVLSAFLVPSSSSAQDSGGILGGPVVGGGDSFDSEPVPPPDLQPLPQPEPTPTWTPIPLPQDLGVAVPRARSSAIDAPSSDTSSLTERRSLTSPAAGSRVEEDLSPAIPKLEDLPEPGLIPKRDSPAGIPAGVVAEIQPAGGVYRAAKGDNLNVQGGERLRWKYPGDRDWRVLEAYQPTVVRMFDHHYEVGGNFFHSFQTSKYRVQVPTLEDAQVRRDPRLKISPTRETFRLFVEVDANAPKAPKPEGNCLVWQKERLWLNDRVSGEIDTVLSQNHIDHLEVTALVPGMIYVLEPPSKVVTYAVKVDFEREIFASLGIQKGESDARVAELTQKMQMATTENEVKWCQAQIAYEQAQAREAEERKQYYEYYFAGSLDEFNLIRSGHPKPHVQMAKMTYRHQNLEITAGMFSDHKGEILIPADAFLWINQALPVTGTPFSFEIVDKSEPSFIGYDTRFRSEGSDLKVEQQEKDAPGWGQRPVAIDTYTYASLRPPQPGSPPEYLLDITSDISGGLKRLNQDMIVNARLGTIQLTPDVFRIDLDPNLLISPIAMNDLLRDILTNRFQMEAWLKGRERKIHQVMDHVPIVPDLVLDTLEGIVDELCLRIYELEQEERMRTLNYRFKPFKVHLTLAKQGGPGQFSLTAQLEDAQGKTLQAAQGLQSQVDLIDYLASSVAANRSEINFQAFNKLSYEDYSTASPTVGQAP